MKTKKLSSMTKFECILIIFLSLLGILTIYPFYNVVVTSFASTEAMAKHSPYLWFYDFDLTGYKTIIDDEYFFKSLVVSLFVTIVGTSINMFLSVCGAYALSKKDLIGRKIILTIIIFSMLFSGGLVPTYLVMQSYGLVNNIFSMILPTAISAYYLLLMKNYFSEIPASLVESAKIDGANEIFILLKIILPLSVPFLATFTLFYSVERWNEWWNALLYISEKNLQPLQIYTRDVLIAFNTQLAVQAQLIIGTSGKVNIQSVQMAVIVITAMPILCLYPFLQRHFVKGILMGSVKE